MPRRPNVEAGDPVPPAPRNLPRAQRSDWEHLRGVIGAGGVYKAAWAEDLRLLVQRRARLRAMNGKTPEADRRALEREVRAQLVAFGLARGRGAAALARPDDGLPKLYRQRDGSFRFDSDPAFEPKGAQLVGVGRR